MRSYAIIAAFALTLASAPAFAGAADKAWSDETTIKFGNPSITLHSTDGLSMTMQSEILGAAHDEGMTIDKAVTTFLGEYAPKQCSHVMDMSVPHKNMKVRLYIQYDVTHLYKDDPRIKQAITVGPETIDLVINYVPTRTVKCVNPTPTS